MSEGEPREPDLPQCERCSQFMPEGYCASCEDEELQIGGWQGSITLGVRRVNHLPQD